MTTSPFLPGQGGHALAPVPEIAGRVSQEDIRPREDVSRTDDVFLPAHQGIDARDMRSPARDGNAIAPLVTAAEVYPALERAVLGATRTVHLSFRILDPTMRCFSDDAQARGLETWAELIVDAARRGAHVRFLLSDFDPIMGADLHRLSWRSYLAVGEAARDLSEEARARLEVMTSLHEARAGPAMRALFWPIVWRRLSGLAAALKGETRHTIGKAPHELTRSLREDENILLHELPGVWRVVSKAMDLAPEEWAEQLERSAERGRLARLHAPLWPPAHLWPVTHHQKLALFDGSEMIVGGLDLNERRYDDPAHDRPAEETWHDLSVHVRGPVVADAERHFRETWNAEGERFRPLLEELKPLLGRARRLVVPKPLEVPSDACAAPEPAGPVRAQFLRTLSRRRPGAFAFTPISVRRDLEEGHRAVIGAATKLLYIETQYFRLRSMSRAIAAQAKRHPELRVIVLMPNAPEDVAWDDNRAVDATHGEFLQVRALNLLKRRLGKRLGLYMLRQRGRTEREHGRAKAFDTGIVYLHSKVVIADDRAALVSSANMNGRSFRWDTEAGILWTQDASSGEGPPHEGPVTDLRLALWNAHLPRNADPIWPLDDAFAAWKALSDADLERPLGTRHNFVAPYQIGRARRFARRSLFVPDDMI